MKKVFFAAFVLILCVIKVSCLDDVKLRGPSVLESSHQPWYELTCSFSHDPQEMNELDIKWYYGPGDSPFLQWVPGTGQSPQTVESQNNSENKFTNRLQVNHSYENVTNDDGVVTKYKVEQTIRFYRPSIYLTGNYTCKVATFFTEHKSRHQVIIFDPGLGPSLSYVTEPPNTVILCRVQQVFPEPNLELSILTDAGAAGLKSPPSDMTTTTVQRGLMYDVMVNTSLDMSLLSLQTMFTCRMEIPGTQFSLKEETMYLSSDIRNIDIHLRHIL